MSNKIYVNKYYIQIEAQGNDPQLLTLLNRVDTPDIFPARRKNTYYCSLKYLPEVLETLRGISSCDKLTGLVRELYLEETQRRRVTPLLKEYGATDSSDLLWDHQQLGVEIAQVNRRYGFFYDTRTGKTMMALQIMKNALMAGKARRCIVVCPSSIIQSWLTDAATHFPELKVVAYYGSAKQKELALSTPSHIILWSMEQFAKNMAWLQEAKFDMCFVDESSKLKSHKTQISKALREFSMMVPYWYLLSATPAPNNESEYYTQMMTIDPYIFNPARTKFVRLYFNNMARNPAWEDLIVRKDMYGVLNDKIEQCAIYVDQSVMPTAGKEWHEINYDLPVESRKVYNRMRYDMAVELETGTITTDQAAIMRGKLNQIASGFIMDTAAINENKIARKLGESTQLPEILPIVDGGDFSRIEQLDKLLQELGDQKVVIWANYRQEFYMLQDLLGDQARYIRGGCSVEDKEQFIGEFKGGPLQYLVCHPLSVGMGINLTEAHTAIYYSLNDSWEAFKQSSERIAGHIKTQPNKCHYYVIIANNTVDALIYDNLKNKREASFAFTEHLKAGALE